MHYLKLMCALYPACDGKPNNEFLDILVVKNIQQPLIKCHCPLCLLQMKVDKAIQVVTLEHSGRGKKAELHSLLLATTFPEVAIVFGIYQT